MSTQSAQITAVHNGYLVHIDGKIFIAPDTERAGNIAVRELNKAQRAAADAGKDGARK